jgi:hypothetical protein
MCVEAILILLVGGNMSTVIPIEKERMDPEGNLLVPARPYDTFRHRVVWAVYRFPPECGRADARCSKFIGIAEAKRAADDLNRSRSAGQAHYYRVYRPSVHLPESDNPEISARNSALTQRAGVRDESRQPTKERK